MNKIKISLIIFLALTNCSFRERVKSTNIVYKDSLVLISFSVSHKKKINDSYFYYGEMESKLLGSKNELSEMPYIIATSKDQKSKFYFDSIADYPDFFDNLEWSQEVKRSKVYIAFKTEVNVDEISLKKVDKKFKHFSLDFYDQ